MVLILAVTGAMKPNGSKIEAEILRKFLFVCLMVSHFETKSSKRKINSSEVVSHPTPKTTLCFTVVFGDVVSK